MTTKPGEEVRHARAPAVDAALGACRKVLLVVGAFSAAVNVLMLAPALYMMQVFDRVLSSRSLETLAYLTIITIVTLCAMVALDMVRSRLVARIGAFLDRRLAPEVFERVVMATVEGRPYGVQPLRDLAQVRAYLGSHSLFALFDAPWLPLYLGIVFLIHPVLGLIATAGAVALFAVGLLNETHTRGAINAAGAKSMRTMQRAEVAVRNAEVVEAMGMFAGYGRTWMRDVEAASNEQTRASDSGSTYQAMARLLRQVIQIFMYAAGAWLVVQQDMTAGAMTAATILMARGLSPVEQAIGGWRGLVSARTSYHRLNQFLGEQTQRAQAISLPEPSGKIAVDRLTYAPRGTSRLLLKGVSFQLNAGEVLAIAGPSGAGKSTLARALVGVVLPTAGHVRLDGAEIHSWNRIELGQYLGYLPQDIELFDGTVKENIARMGEARDTDVVAAAKIADVHDLILHLPHGYHTRLGDGGRALSAGQRQRVGLARAVFGRPKLVVLDEPDSALDIDGEAALERAILQLKEAGTTVVVVTHRPRLLGVADKILVLRNGAVDAFGPAAEIAQRMRPQAIAPQAPAPAAPTKGTVDLGGKTAALARARRETAS